MRPAFGVPMALWVVRFYRRRRRRFESHRAAGFEHSPSRRCKAQVASRVLIDEAASFEATRGSGGLLAGSRRAQAQHEIVFHRRKLKATDECEDIL